MQPEYSRFSATGCVTSILNFIAAIFSVQYPAYRDNLWAQNDNRADATRTYSNAARLPQRHPLNLRAFSTPHVR